MSRCRGWIIAAVPPATALAGCATQPGFAALAGGAAALQIPPGLADLFGGRGMRGV